MKQEDKLRQALREYYDQQETHYDPENWRRASAHLSAIRRKRKVAVGLVLTGLLAGLFFIGQALRSDRGHIDEWPGSRLMFAVSTQQSSARVKPDGVQPFKAPVALKKKDIQKRPTATASNLRRAGVRNERTALDSDDRTPAATGDSPGTAVAASQNGTYVPKPERDTARQEVVQPNRPGEVVTQPGELPTTPGGTASQPIEETRNAVAPKLGLPATPLDKFREEPVATLMLPMPGQESETRLLANVQGTSSASTPSMSRPNGSVNDTSSSAVTPPLAKQERDGQSVPGASFTAPANDSELFVNGPLPDSTRIFNTLIGKGLYAQAGAAWLYGWKSERREARGWVPTAALNYMCRLQPRIGLSLGVGYFCVTHLTNGSKTSRVSDYEYGERSDVTTIKPVTLHYAVLPVKVLFQEQLHQAFGVGVNLGYLVNVTADVARYRELPGFTGDRTVTRRRGYTRGFSWYDVQATLCYRRRLSNFIAVEAEAFIGLHDVRLDDFFGLGGKEKNSGARLSLIYYIFNRENNP